MLHFNIAIFSTVIYRHIFCQTQISSTAPNVTSLESCSECHPPNLTLIRCPWTSPETCPYRFYAVTSVWIFLFSFSRRTAHCGQVASVCIAQFPVLQFHCTITSKYRFLLLFCALNTRITSSNNAVGKGMKQSRVENWIFFNTVTQFCSTLAFTVQFKLLLQRCWTAQNIVQMEKGI